MNKIDIENRKSIDSPDSGGAQHVVGARAAVLEALRPAANQWGEGTVAFWGYGRAE